MTSPDNRAIFSATGVFQENNGMEWSHPIGEGESLFASGTYQYFENDTAVDVVEPWVIHACGYNTYNVRSMRLAGAYGNRIEVFSRHAADQLQLAHLWWHSDEGPHNVEAIYTPGENGLKVERKVDEGDWESEVVSAKPNLIVSPLMRIYVGWVINRLVARDGEANVVVPWIKDPSDTAQIFTPLVSKREAALQRRETIKVDGHKCPANVYEYTGGEYQPGSMFWVSDNGILLRYVWQMDEDACWDIRLADYKAPA